MKRILLPTITLICLVASLINAAIPQLINYQGSLTDSAGTSLDTIVNMVFTIYDDPFAGSVIWTETQPTVTVTAGQFNVLLGSVSPIFDTVFNDATRYLGVKVGTDPEITPRSRLVTTPYAFRVSTVDGATGGIISGDVSIQSDLIVDGNIGIGTTSPAAYLHIKGPTLPAGEFLRIEPTDVNVAPKISFRHTDGSEVMTIIANPSGAHIDGIGGAPLYLGAGGFVRETIHSNGNVGIGTLSPTEKLEVSGTVFSTSGGFKFPDNTVQTTAATGGGGNGWVDDGTAVRLETATDKVGIGTATPLTRLHVLVSSGEGLPGNAGSRIFLISNNASASQDASLGIIAGSSGRSSVFFGDNSSSTSGAIRYHNSTESMQFHTGDVSRMTLDGSGNLGIGTTGPAEKLDVSGNIHASGTIISGNSITIDGLNDRIIASSGTLELSVQHLIVTGKATVGTGHTNTGTKSFVAGENNTVSGTASTVSGGSLNTADTNWATVGGGVSNVASGFRSTVGGGQGNTASDNDAVIAGGLNNSASGTGSTVAGGINNSADASSATVGGGSNNVANGSNAFVGGGASDSATASFATVSGGISNIASAWGATVGGGGIGRASGSYATLAGGFSNTASGDSATVSGGAHNFANGIGSAVGGGGFNIAQGAYSVVGGGGGATATDSNSALGEFSTIAGGRHNSAPGKGATIGGGRDNTASDLRATISGGILNTASAINSTVGGGAVNSASGVDATVAGGNSGTASGTGAMVPGGVFNTASGLYSFAAGRQAKALHDGAFVWADNLGADIASVAANQFVVRASGGIWLGTTSSPTATAGRFIETSTGGYLSSGGVWTNSSDKDLKENFVPIDRQELLEKISTLPISQWNYKAESDAVKHIGPTAQDFYEHFGLGNDDKAISTIDPASIALAAIQELYEKSKRVDILENELAKLRELVEQLIANQE